MDKDNNGMPGTTDQKPRWEGPPQNRPPGYLPATDDPETDRDAADENLQDSDRGDMSDAVTTTNDKELDRDWLPLPDSERDLEGRASEAEDRRPLEEFPPFDDPAFSSKPAQPPRRPLEDAAASNYVGHAEFTQNLAREAPRPDAAAAAALDDAPASDDRAIIRRKNANPDTQKTSGAGPALAERSKDARPSQ